MEKNCLSCKWFLKYKRDKLKKIDYVPGRCYNPFVDTRKVGTDTCLQWEPDPEKQQKGDD